MDGKANGHLTLDRRVGEALVIETPAGPVRVWVLDVREGVVRLGFAAARTIPVWRSEVIAQYGRPALREGRGT